MSKKNKIKVIIPFHNPGDFLDMCINSVLTQDYDNYDVLFIDDSSTDDSYNKIPACTYQTDEKNEPMRDEKGELIITDIHPILEITKCTKINAWRSSKKLTALPNIHNAILNSSQDPDDIIFILYGDDWLVNKNVLSKINDYYNEKNCLLTYGSGKLSDGKKCYSGPYTEKEFSVIRRITPKISHPITFKKSLYTKFLDKDPLTKSFIDDEGNWFTCCADMAIFYPLAELAGFNNVLHVNDITYIHNVDNPINSEKTNLDLYYNTQDSIQNKKSLLA
jgi:glycosyltransferase involved in cell wall biosynthesis